MKRHGVPMRHHSGIREVVDVGGDFCFVMLQLINQFVSRIQSQQDIFLLEQDQLFLTMGFSKYTEEK